MEIRVVPAAVEAEPEAELVVDLAEVPAVVLEVAVVLLDHCWFATLGAHSVVLETRMPKTLTAAVFPPRLAGLIEFGLR